MTVKDIFYQAWKHGKTGDDRPFCGHIGLIEYDEKHLETLNDALEPHRAVVERELKSRRSVVLDDYMFFGVNPGEDKCSMCPIGRMCGGH